MIFDLGFVFWDGGRHSVALNTRLIFKPKLDEVPYHPWGRWHYFIMQDGLVATYPVKRRGANHAVVFVRGESNLSKAFNDLKGVKPFQISMLDPHCQQVCFAAASISKEEKSIPQAVMMGMDEDVWCLDEPGWALIRTKSMLAIGLDFVDGGIDWKGTQGRVMNVYADQEYKPDYAPEEVLS